MKLTPVYQFLKTRLSAIPELKLVTWWNGQTADTIIHTTPAAYIQFPNPMPMRTMGGGAMQNTDILIRIVLVSSLLMTNEGTINDTVMEPHEELALRIYERLQRNGFEFGTGDTGLSSINIISAQLDMNTPGIVATVQDFSAILMQRDRKAYIEVSPSLSIQKT